MGVVAYGGIGATNAADEVNTVEIAVIVVCKGIYCKIIAIPCIAPRAHDHAVCRTKELAAAQTIGVVYILGVVCFSGFLNRQQLISRIVGIPGLYRAVFRLREQIACVSQRNRAVFAWFLCENIDYKRLRGYSISIV